MNPTPNAHSGAHDAHAEALDLRAGEYVLGTLPAAERAAVAQQLTYDPALQAAVTAWQERLAPLNQLAEPVPPPAALWRRIDASLTAASAPAAAVPYGAAPRRLEGWRRWWNDLALWRGLAGAGMAAAAVMATVLLTQSLAPEAPPRFMVVLVAPQDKAPGWVVQARSSREVQLIPLGKFEVPPDRALQFWTKADGWSGPVSLGLVQPGQPLHIPLQQLPPLESNQLFELTLEPAQGSPIGKPTGPIQFIGRAVQVL